MTNPIGINNLSQSSNIANATGDEVVSLDKHINTSATDTDQIQAFIVSILSHLTIKLNGRRLTK